jgi:hypothetical protein
MSRFFRAAILGLLVASLVALVLVSTSAAGHSSAQLRGTVAATLPANGLIRVDSRRTAHFLRVLGSQARIHVGQRVELRERILRQRGHGSRVLSRNVVVVRSVAIPATAPATAASASKDDDDSHREDRPDDNSGPGRGDDEDDDNSGPGKGGDHDDTQDDDTTDDTTDDDTTDDDTQDDDTTDDD